MKTRNNLRYSRCEDEDQQFEEIKALEDDNAIDETSHIQSCKALPSRTEDSSTFEMITARTKRNDASSSVQSYGKHRPPSSAKKMRSYTRNEESSLKRNSQGINREMLS